jgi:hypothetical protein
VELVGANPVDRGKPGSKDHLIVDRHGIPLGVALSTANTHDWMVLAPRVDAVPRSAGRLDELAGHGAVPPSSTPTRPTITAAAAGPCGPEGSAWCTWPAR